MRSFLPLLLVPIAGLILSSWWVPPQNLEFVLLLNVAMGILAAVLWARLSTATYIDPNRVVWLFYLYLSATFALWTIGMLGEWNTGRLTAADNIDKGYAKFDRGAILVCLSVTYYAVLRYQKLVTDSLKIHKRVRVQRGE